MTPARAIVVHHGAMSYGEVSYGEGSYGGAAAALVRAVSDPSAVRQFQAYVNDMSPAELMALFGWLWQSLNATLDDPRRGMYTTLLLLPFLAVVLHAIRKSRND